MSGCTSITGLIPRRNSTYWLTLVGGVALVLLLGGLHLLGDDLAHWTTDGRIAALDLDSEGSVASWCSIVLLFLCGLSGLLVRRLRAALGCTRSEIRCWALVASLWFIMSLDEGASLHEAFKEMMVRVTGTRVFGDGSIYWAVPYFAMLTTFGLFVLQSVWRCRDALACVLASGVCYTAAIVAQFEMILGTRPAIEAWIEESFELLGGLFVWLTLSLYARTLAVELEDAAALVEIRDSRHEIRDKNRTQTSESHRLHTATAPLAMRLLALAVATMIGRNGNTTHRRER